jgi:hypothetical protein
MSTHGKPRIPPHQHLSTEIQQARQVRNSRPAYRGVHWSDTVIDGNKTLDETIVDFTRQWEADILETNWGDAPTKIADPESTEGYCVKWANASAYGNVKTETGDLGLAGVFYVIVRANISDNSSGTKAMRFGVWDEDTSTRLAYREVAPNEFTANDTYQLFAVKCNIDENKNNIAIHADFMEGHPAVDLQIDYLAVTSADVPLGTQDTETDAHSGADVNAHSGADVNAHSGTDTNAHSGSAASSSLIPLNSVLDTGLSSEVEITNSADTEIQSGTTDADANATNLAEIIIDIQRGSSGGYGNVRVIVDTNGVSPKYDERTLYISADLDYYQYRIFVSKYFNSTAIRVLAKKDGIGSVYLQAYIRVRNFGVHTHTMTNPSNHTVTQPSNHSVTQPSNHSVTQPNAHVVTNPPHEH